MTVDTVLFDVGGVLLDWDRRHLYRKLIADEAEMTRFLSEVCTVAWNEAQDGGRGLLEATTSLCAEFPHHRALIEAFYSRFGEMLSGEVPGMLDIVAALRARGVPLYGLSNASAETFHHCTAYPIVGDLKGIVVSGAEKVMKPNRRIFQIAIDRFGLVPERTLFVDDVAKNVAGAEAAGFKGHHFTGAAGLRSTLTALGLL
jgi:2-haloacid dehalogenase